MVGVLVIADDFTGALDTAIQFSKHGLSTITYTSGKAFLEHGPKKEQACVVNTDSRHIQAGQAYDIVKEIAQYGQDLQAKYIYKKTDSALRGNVGKELEAMLDAAGGHCIFFAPAYPKNNRITLNGVQYYQGRPIADTFYGKDPIDPVLKSDVEEIIAGQSDVRVVKCTVGGDSISGAGEGPCITLWDAVTEKQMDEICSIAMAQEGTILMAGCAGLAEHLACRIGGAKRPRQRLPTTKKLLIISGSLNPISMQQVEHAKRRGCPCISLREEVELTAAFCESADYEGIIVRAKAILNDCGILLLEPVAPMDEKSQRRRRTTNNCKEPAEAIGRIAHSILEGEEDYGLVVFGGDTLLAVADQLFYGEIEPFTEIQTGIPLSLAVDHRGYKRIIVTKSGGFGAADVIQTICKYLNCEGLI